MKAEQTNHMRTSMDTRTLRCLPNNRALLDLQIGELLSSRNSNVIRRLFQELQKLDRVDNLIDYALDWVIKYGEASHLDLLGEAGFDVCMADAFHGDFPYFTKVEPTERRRNIHLHSFAIHNKDVSTKRVHMTRNSTVPPPDSNTYINAHFVYGWVRIMALKSTLKCINEMLLLAFTGDHRIPCLLEKLFVEKRIHADHYVVAMDMLGAVCMLRNDIPACMRWWLRSLDFRAVHRDALLQAPSYIGSLTSVRTIAALETMELRRHGLLQIALLALQSSAMILDVHTSDGISEFCREITRHIVHTEASSTKPYSRNAFRNHRRLARYRK